MNLPYDIARCGRTTHLTCATCRRTEPGDPVRQVYIAPPIDMRTGHCPAYIGHPPARMTNNTAEAA